MGTNTKRPRGKAKRVVRLLSWSPETYRGRVLVLTGQRLARFTLELQQVTAEEPMTRWRLTCRCCHRAQIGEVLARGGIVQCACRRWERDGRCPHVEII